MHLVLVNRLESLRTNRVNSIYVNLYSNAEANFKHNNPLKWKPQNHITWNIAVYVQQINKEKLNTHGSNIQFCVLDCLLNSGAIVS